jgi:hypothetical protein
MKTKHYSNRQQIRVLEELVGTFQKSAVALMSSRMMQGIEGLPCTTRSRGDLATELIQAFRWELERQYPDIFQVLPRAQKGKPGA